MKKLILFYLLLLIHGMHGEKSEKSIIGSDGTGFFVNFSRALNHIYHCKVHNKIPVIYWNEQSSYYDPKGYNGSTNAWEYYFEPVSAALYQPGDFIRRDSYSDNFSVFWDYHQYIENINLLNKQERVALINITHQPLSPNWRAPVRGQHIYAKQFRRYVKHTLIDPYIKIKSNILAKIDSFYEENMARKKVIGIHLRGKFIDNILPYVPVEIILETANQLADPDTIFFVATDQYPLIQKAQELLRGPVIFCDIQRFANTSSPIGSDKPKLHPKLGEDILVETMLLARCDHLVHTISNVSTSTLMFNPEMDHTCLY